MHHQDLPLRGIGSVPWGCTLRLLPFPQYSHDRFAHLDQFLVPIKDNSDAGKGFQSIAHDLKPLDTVDMKAAKQFDWSKTELIAQIAAQAHEEIALAIEEVCYVESQEKHIDKTYGVTKAIKYNLQQLILRCQRLCVKGGRRRWRTILCPIYTEKQIAFMRC